ncbi:MAG: phosphatase RsbU N-terminal domain-containing protein [Frankiaceae bacterium]
MSADQGPPATVEAFRRDYKVVLLRCLGRPDERAFHDAYQLGRCAVEGQLSLLELAEIHHEILADVLRTATEPDEIPAVAACAARFLVELLAPYEMSQRTLAEIRGIEPS